MCQQRRRLDPFSLHNIYVFFLKIILTNSFIISLSIVSIVFMSMNFLWFKVIVICICQQASSPPGYQRALAALYRFWVCLPMRSCGYKKITSSCVLQPKQRSKAQPGSHRAMVPSQVYSIIAMPGVVLLLQVECFSLLSVFHLRLTLLSYGCVIFLSSKSR